MVKRWILYMVALACCVIYYAAYQGWVALALLATVAVAPWLSLAVSLLPMLLAKPQVTCPTAVSVGSAAELELSVSCRMPMPPYRFWYRFRHTLTGETGRLRMGETVPTGHCGVLECTRAVFAVYDYMGMFCLPLRRAPDLRIRIRPRAVAMEPPGDLGRHLATSWQPKHGGGFAEHHELRLYRPGDGLNQIHWKLSAKTGKLIVREPMVPRPGRILLSADLMGTPEQLDRILGKLQWMGAYLLEQGLIFSIYVLTGDGPQLLPVNREDGLVSAIDTLLAAAPAREGTVLEHRIAASWQYHIGGDGDEA